MADGRPRGFGIAAGLDPDVAREVAQRCESLGYASLWSNDHPAASGLETIAVFAAGGAAARRGRGRAGARPPRARRTWRAKLSEVGHRRRSACGSASARASRSARSASCARGSRRCARCSRRQVRIVVAAMGPKMCALAGAEADGVFLNWMTPEKAAWARERVHEGAAAAGRAEPPPVFGYVRVAVGDDAEERLRKEESFYRQLHQGYIRHFEALGAPEGTVGIAARDPAEVAPRLAEYDAIDHVVVRALAHADAESLGEVAAARSRHPDTLDGYRRIAPASRGILPPTASEARIRLAPPPRATSHQRDTNVPPHSKEQGGSLEWPAAQGPGVAVPAS